MSPGQTKAIHRPSRLGVRRRAALSCKDAHVTETESVDNVAAQTG